MATSGCPQPYHNAAGSVKQLFACVSLGSGKTWKDACSGACEEESCHTGKSLFHVCECFFLELNV